MDFASILNKNEPHKRIILHIDMDCFYAQVEELKDPKLKLLPLGIQQKNIVVTCNYIAREMGVKKLMLISEAKRLCPQIVLVKGEDLTPYRQMSQKIFEVLHEFTPTVEKLGFDENFLDITSLVEQKMSNECNFLENTPIEGHIYPDNGKTLFDCSCGCAPRLIVATQIAKVIRETIYEKLGMTCCAGISYNKLLAKLVGSQNKPNKQTVLVSTYAEQFMRELKDLNRITGIGQKTQTLLLESGIETAEELQQCDMDFLRKKFGFETATKLKDLSFGRDTSTVRPTGKPKTIGLEDSCRPISVRTEVEDRFRLLLMRLMEQVSEDGRIPIAIKVILRKSDSQKKTSHRETKQANILPSLFKMTGDTCCSHVCLADGSQEKLLKIIMRLFERVVDLNKPFNITLIGLAFSKFQQRKVGSSSIANFLIKKDDLEVQSITSLTNTPENITKPQPATSVNNDEEFRSSPTTFQPSSNFSDQFYRRRTAASSPIPMLIGDNNSESGATNSDFSDFSETEIEPSPKKSRISRLMMDHGKRRCLGSTAIYNSENAEMASPSKLRVCDLRLNSRDSEKDLQISPCSTPSSTNTTPTSNTNTTILSEINLRPTLCATRQLSIASSSSSTTPMDVSGSSTPTTPQASISNTSITGNLTFPCPAGVDPQVFSELPISVQNELINSWRSSLAAAAVAVVNDVTNPGATTSTSTTNNHTQTTKAGGATSSTSQKNTLYRYFLRNK